MIKTSFLTLAFATMLMGTAHAAFEWVPPVQNNTSVAVTPTVSNDFVPMPPKEIVASEPIAEQPQPSVAMPTPIVETQMAMASSAGKEPEIIWNPRDDMIVQTGAMPEQPMMPEGFVEGFGRDIPLSIAVTQIVPENFAVQYGQNISPDTLVNWQGGRNWKAALTDAVSAQNMKVNITGQTVMIESTAPTYVAPATILPQPVASNAVAAEPMPAMTANNTETAFLDNAALFAPLMPTMNDARPMRPQTIMWVAPRASTLRQVLTDWSREAGVQLQWSAQYDYPLMSDVQFEGNFEEAVENILAGLVDAQPRPVARLHPNEPSGPAILVVETRYIME